MPLAGVLVQYSGWSSVFYVYGERSKTECQLQILVNSLFFLPHVLSTMYCAFISTLSTYLFSVVNTFSLLHSSCYIVPLLDGYTVPLLHDSSIRLFFLHGSCYIVPLLDSSYYTVPLLDGSHYSVSLSDCSRYIVPVMLLNCSSVIQFLLYCSSVGPFLLHCSFVRWFPLHGSSISLFPLHGFCYTVPLLDFCYTDPLLDSSCYTVRQLLVPLLDSFCFLCWTVSVTLFLCSTISALGFLLYFLLLYCI